MVEEAGRRAAAERPRAAGRVWEAGPEGGREAGMRTEPEGLRKEGCIPLGTLATLVTLVTLVAAAMLVAQTVG